MLNVGTENGGGGENGALGKGMDVDALRAAICDALHLYAEKNEEEFKPYLERS